MGFSKSKKDYSRYKVTEIMETISERKNSNWGKFLCRASMDDNLSTVDVRNLKIDPEGEITIGKGISLTNEEADSLANALLSNGYGDTDKLMETVSKRKKMYGFKEQEKEECGPLVIGFTGVD